MIVLLTSAKTLDYTSPYKLSFAPSQPMFLEQSALIASQLKKLSLQKLRKVLEVNEKLADLNYERLQNWQEEHTLENARPALLAYQGDVYKHIDHERFTPSQQEYAQRTIRTFSGLYGLVRAYDLIEPYRLEMRTSLPKSSFKNLAAFWKKTITQELAKELAEDPQPLLVNLASKEYADAVDFSAIKFPQVHVKFQQNKNGEIHNFGILAKLARSRMANFLIKCEATTIADIKEFHEDGYSLKSETKTTLSFIKNL